MAGLFSERNRTTIGRCTQPGRPNQSQACCMAQRSGWNRIKNTTALVDMLATNPYITINQGMKRLGVAFTTVQRAVEKVGNAKLTP